MGAGEFLNALVRGSESSRQQRLRIGFRAFCVNLLNRLYRDAAGFLSALVSSHAVGNHRQATFLLQLVVGGGLPEGEAIFIIVALAAYIAQTGQLNGCVYAHQLWDYTGAWMPIGQPGVEP